MSSSDIKQPTRFIDKVSVYGLEFAVAMVTMIVSVSVLSFAVFALCNYFAYDSVGTGRGYFALWSSASTIVWVPVALLFYVRVRAYMAQHPDVVANPVQRVFTVIYQVIMILTIISFAVAAVYALLTSFVKPDETSDILLGVALPSAVSGILFAGALVSFFRQPIVRRRTFAVVFSLVSFLIVVPTIVVSIMSLRSANTDSTTETDLYSIKSAVDDYSRESEVLPSSLDDIVSYINDDNTIDRLDDYSYKRVDDDRYQLCADFTEASQYVRASTYRSYVSFNQHKQGQNCFKIQAATSSFDYGM